MGNEPGRKGQRMLWPMILAGLMGLNSCKNDIETINALTSELNLPDQSGFNIEITYTGFRETAGKKSLHLNK